MNATQDIRALFLEEFIKRIIIKSQVSPKIKQGEVLLEKLDEVVIAAPKLEITPEKDLFKEIEQPKKVYLSMIKKPEQPIITPALAPKLPLALTPPLPPVAAPKLPLALTPPLPPAVIQKAPLALTPPLPPAVIQKVPLALVSLLPREQPPIIPKPKIPVKSIMPATPQMPPRQEIQISNLLNRIFSDPAVQVLNCPGPNKNILITKMGRIQPSQTSFTEIEINKFMNELSEQTRIPLMPGLIKVIFQNLIITSVVSEFIGTKFVAERRQQGPLRAPARVQFR